MSGAMSKSFYKRKLPSPPAIAFSSSEGIQYFQEALQEGTALSFFKLSEQYSTQSEPAFCGLTSISMVLNALAIDPRRTWKAPWRWFDESLLDCCKPLSKIKEEGVSLKQAACLAQCNGASVGLHQFGEFTIDWFREIVRSSCRFCEQLLIVSYARSTFQQTGSGHFSPIGAYLENRDLVLILDTARFKYPPHWVPLELLYEAMGEIDSGTGKPRGLLTLKAPETSYSICYTINRRDNWEAANQYILSTAPQLLKEMTLKGHGFDSMVKAFVEQCPIESVQQFLAIRVSDCELKNKALISIQQHFLSELCELPVFKVIKGHLESSWTHDEHCIGRITILFLLMRRSLWLVDVENESLRLELEHFMDLSERSLVQDEVSFIGYQLENLIAFGELPNEDQSWTTGKCKHHMKNEENRNNC